MTSSFHSHSVPSENGLSQNSQKVITEADVLITAALADRPARVPDLAAENQALHTIARQLMDDPPGMLKTLVRIARDLCPCDTAGVSLLETLADGTKVFRWVAIAGALKSLEQTIAPANFSPCGTTIQCGQPQLYARPERYFTYLHHPQFPIVEGLLLPICANDRQLGTLWIISHNELRQFDREDQRLMTSLAGFTAAALHSIHQRQTAELALQRQQAARLETEATRQALDEAAGRAVDILESITDAFISLDSEWRITYVNQAVVRINNLQREEMIGKTHWEMWPWSVGTIVEQTYRQVVADQVAAHFEVFYEPLKMWLEIHAYPAPAGLSIYFRDISDAYGELRLRKQAENALRESEAFNRSVFESSADCLKVLDINGCLLSMNGPGRCLMEIEDCTPLVGTPWIEFWHDSDRSKADNAVKTAAAGGTGRFSGYCPTVKGTPKWWDVAVTPILDVAGKPKQLLVISRDLSDRKLAEDALQQMSDELERQLRKFDAIASSVPDFIYTFDLSGRFSYINQPLLNLWQKTLDEAAGKNFFELDYPTDIATQLQNQIQQVIETRQPLKDETPYTSAFGTRAHEYIFVPLFNANGAVEAVAGVTRDITDRKLAEAALRDSEEKFRNMADHAPFMVWVTDPTGYCHYLSQSWYDFTGQTPETGLGFGWLNVTHPDDREYAEQTFVAANQRQEAFRLEYRLRRSDGEYIWAIDAASPWFGADGQFKGYIGSVIDIDDRKQAESALRRSEERYRTLFESIDEGFCVIEVLFDANDTPIDYRFLEINPVFEAQTGLRQALGKTARQLLPDLEDHWIKIYGQVALTGESVRFESGSEVMNRWFDVYACRTGQPEERKVAIVFKDISDRKRIEAERIAAQKALQASEEQSRNILESITDGFFALDRDWRFTYVNRQGERLLDRTPGDLLGKTIWEEYPGTVGMEFERVYRQVASERVASSFISFYPDHNRWYEAHAYPAADGITVYFRNATDRKQSEQALMESEANARTKAEEVAALMEITPAAIWIAQDPQCHQMTANRTAYKLMRTEPGSVTTATPADGSHPLPFKQQKNGQEILPQDLPMQKAIRTNQEVTDELEFVFEDGTVQVIYGKAVPLYDSAGIIRGAIAAFVDITGLKQIEREREQLLQREQTAREAAETANRIKDEFLAVLSHELRSPLNPILGWSRLLQNRKLDASKTALALATIERNAQLQSKLIEDLLDVSRILQGKLSLTVTPVNLASTIRSAIETVRLATEAKSIAVEVSLDPNVSSVSGDATRLQQVVWNLLSNAVKFSPAGGWVAVRLAQVDNQVQITVRDNGKGIPREFLPYVFDYFRQADGATTRQFGGLGLGLAIVRHLVELHGGTVEADSPGEGLGATFTVRLPLMPISPTADREEQFSQSSLNLQGVRVLVVDDDRDTREFVVFLLEQAEAIVISATSASEAFAVLTQSQPDILLSDIGMSDMDGYMLMRQVRALPPEQGGQIPAIALTAYAGDFNEKQALAAGFQRHVAKPVEPNELLKAIVTLLNC